jgi:hypothetical protein
MYKFSNAFFAALPSKIPFLTVAYREKIPIFLRKSKGGDDFLTFAKFANSLRRRSSDP